MTHFDIAIVGAGMAGASLAAEVAPHATVLLLEAEDQPGYHATGRSAAFWSETYGGPDVQPLTSASGSFLHAHGFLRSRGALHIGRTGDEGAIVAFAAAFPELEMPRLDRAALAARLPGLKPGWDHALAEPGCTDIDVAGLHAHYLSSARQSGAAIRCAAPLRSAERGNGHWSIEAGGDTLAATTLVNAAGAWADGVAAMAGAAPLGITPYRRTLMQLRVAPPVPADLPLVIDIAGRFYFKPEAGGRLWLSPHDETSALPGDAAPEEIDVAIAIARLQEVVDWRVEAVERKWAGLRSFTPDRLPVYGFDPIAPGLFWFAGQGGFGIQTAPAAAQLGAALLLGHAPNAAVSAIDPARYSPARFG